MKFTGFIIGLSLILVLAACSGGGGGPVPAAATVNGINSIDRQGGSAELSVSALDAQGNVLRSGTVSSVSATVEQEGFSAEGGVCDGGQIGSAGPVTAAPDLRRHAVADG